MDVYTAIAGKRDERRYAHRPVSAEHELRILDAGRLTGSSRNTQSWEFVVVAEAQERLADVVYAPGNVRTAGLVVAIVGDHVPVRRRPLRAEHDARRLGARDRVVPERDPRC